MKTRAQGEWNIAGEEHQHGTEWVAAGVGRDALGNDNLRAFLGKERDDAAVDSLGGTTGDHAATTMAP